MRATFFLVTVGLWAPTNASAIITRDDVPHAEYIVQDADHPEVVDLFEPGDCTGTLIDPSFLLTVAHCARSPTHPLGTSPVALHPVARVGGHGRRRAGPSRRATG